MIYLSFIRASGRTSHTVSFIKRSDLGLNMDSGDQSISLGGRCLSGGTGLLLFGVHRIFFLMICKTED